MAGEVRYACAQLVERARSSEGLLRALHFNQQSAPAQSAIQAQRSTAGALFLFMLTANLPVYGLEHAGDGYFVSMMRAALGGVQGTLLHLGLLPLLIPTLLLWLKFGPQAHTAAVDLREQLPSPLYQRCSNCVGVGFCAAGLGFLLLSGILPSQGSVSLAWLQLVAGLFTVVQMNSTLLECGVLQYTRMSSTNWSEAVQTRSLENLMLHLGHVLLPAQDTNHSALAQLLSWCSSSVYVSVMTVSKTVRGVCRYFQLAPDFNPVSWSLVHQERLRMLFEVVDWGVTVKREHLAGFFRVLAEDCQADSASAEQLSRLKSMAEEAVQSMESASVANLMNMEWEGADVVLAWLDNLVQRLYCDLSIQSALVDQFVACMEQQHLSLNPDCTLSAALPKLLDPAELLLRDPEAYMQLQARLTVNCRVCEFAPGMLRSMLMFGQACVGMLRGWCFEARCTFPLDTLPLLLVVQAMSTWLVPQVASVGSLPVRVLLTYSCLHVLASAAVCGLRVLALLLYHLPPQTESELRATLTHADPFGSWLWDAVRDWDPLLWAHSARDSLAPISEQLRMYSRIVQIELNSKAPLLARSLRRIQDAASGLVAALWSWVLWVLLPVFLLCGVLWDIRFSILWMLTGSGMSCVLLSAAQPQSCDLLCGCKSVVCGLLLVPLQQWLWKNRAPVISRTARTTADLVLHMLFAWFLCTHCTADSVRVAKDVYLLYAVFRVASGVGIVCWLDNKAGSIAPITPTTQTSPIVSNSAVTQNPSSPRVARLAQIRPDLNPLLVSQAHVSFGVHNQKSSPSAS